MTDGAHLGVSASRALGTGLGLPHYHPGDGTTPRYYTEDDVRSMTETCDLDGWYAIAALRRLLASHLPHGHQYRPIKDRDRHIIEAANDADPREEQRSVRCWDCRSSGDKPIGPSSGRTWGDEWHEQFEVAYKAAAALLTEIDATSESANATKEQT